MDCDKIVRSSRTIVNWKELIYDLQMVLDAGRLIEFDSPKALLLEKDGLFRALVDESDDRSTLLSLAGIDDSLN